MITGLRISGMNGGDVRDGEFALLAVENAVFSLCGPVDLVAGVGRHRHELHGQVFREEDLSGMGCVARVICMVRDRATQTRFEMDMVGAAHIEAGNDGLERNRALRVGEMNAAQERKLVGGVVHRRRAEAFGRPGAVAGMLRIEAGWRTGRWAVTAHARRRTAGTSWILFCES